ncbi:MAG: glycosyltransferase family 4 protein [Chitinispirillaceae bacterium]|nr:glycosyltransferase family 4 protein [Chitinispirillaceae bacterium]
MNGKKPPQSLKVCHVITRLDLGGSAENTLLTAIGLRQRGHAVDLVCGKSENPASASEKQALGCGVRIVRMAELVRPISPIRDMLALVRLVIMMKRNRYDLLHTHTSKAGILGRIAGYIARVPLVVHTPHGHIFYGYFSGPLTTVFTWLERIVTVGTHALITLTGREKQDYLDRGIGRPERIHPVLSGIDLAPFLSLEPRRDECRAAIGLAPSHFIAGTVARLVPVKNHAMIVDAAALLKDRCPDIRYVFIGDGELREPLTARIRSLDLADRLVMLGWRNDIAECLSMFDLFVMCSRNEGMGRAFVEAQACGVPVIGSRVGGVAETIKEDITGFLVDPHNPEELADKLTRLYTDRALLARMAAACRPHVDPAFGKEVMVEKIDCLYRRLCDERKAA